MSHHTTSSDLSYWEQLTERYFAAETTPDEERELCRFLASPQGQQPQFDDVRHVMGYLITARRLHTAPAAQSPATPAHAPARRLRWKRLAAAAAVALVLVVPPVARYVWQSRNVCVAYVNGQKITDPQLVMQQARRSIEIVADTPNRPTMDSQLNDMFSTLDADLQ